MITLPKDEYERMLNQIELLKKIENVDWELVNKFEEGLEDLKLGRVKRVA